jgi:hypothetical protein
MLQRYNQDDTLEDHLVKEAESLREQASLLPPGAVRDAVMRKARLAETGSRMSDEWLQFPPT